VAQIFAQILAQMAVDILARLEVANGYELFVASAAVADGQNEQNGGPADGLLFSYIDELGEQYSRTQSGINKCQSQCQCQQRRHCSI
jgi:hypothetical protein